MSNDLTRIRLALGDATYADGERMVEAGQVGQTRELQSGTVITGAVTEGGRHRVYIQLNGEDIDGECSCEVGENCAHVAAVLIQAWPQKRGVADIQPSVPAATASRPGVSLVPDTTLVSETSVVSTHQQCLLYRLEAQPLTNACISQGVEIKVSIWVGQRNAQEQWQSAPFVPHVARRGHYPRYVQSADTEILPALVALAAEGPYTLQGEEGGRLLRACLATGRTWWEQIQGDALQSNTALNTESQWVIGDEGLQQLSFQLPDNIVVCPLLEPAFFIDTNKGDAGVLVPKFDLALLQQLSVRPKLTPEGVAEFNAQYDGGIGFPRPRELAINSEPLNGLTAKLHLLEDEAAARAVLYFIYNGQAINSHKLNPEQNFVRFMRNGELHQVERDFNAEAALRHQLSDFIAAHSTDALNLPSKRAWLTFMLIGRNALIRDGWEVVVDEQFPYRMALARDWYGDLLANPLATGVDQPQDWFSLELGIFIDGQPVNILPLLIQQLRHFSLDSSRGSPATLSGVNNSSDVSHEQQIDDQLLLLLEDGRYLPVPMERVQKILETLVELYDQDCLGDDDRLMLPRSQASRLAQLAREAFGDNEDEIAWSGEDALQELAERLSDFDGIEPLTPPQEFQAELRGYQQEGLGWLQFLRQYRAGGILADDMGLGKTVQTLAHLAQEKAQGRLQQPTLIIAPTSLISNWRNEAARFAPHLKLLILHGAQRKQRFDQIGEADLILTTYPLLNFDNEQLLRHDYYLLILDEAQMVKNPRAKASQVVRQLSAEHRLCLTGTPMENHLGELWSLFDFLQPGLLGDERSFQRDYRTPIERGGSEERAQGLAKRIAPFILRRTKEAVATELPAKTEIVRQIPMGDTQRDLYDSIRLTMHKQIRQVIKDQGFARSQIAVLDALLKLRQVCCDPRLLALETAKGVTESAKFETLMTMLPELVEEGRRILLFSQFTSMLALIEAAVADLGIPCVKLTGQTKDRGAVVEHFQNSDVPLFLISLKAGGTGLNLTAADTVIHYDPWWNPAAENQATDRAYRIGQDKPVFVYKLVTEGTVEEKILHLQKNKQNLAAGIYGAKTGSPTRLTQEDLDILLEPLSEAAHPTETDNDKTYESGY